MDLRYDHNSNYFKIKNNKLKSYNNVNLKKFTALKFSDNNLITYSTVGDDFVGLYIYLLKDANYIDSYPNGIRVFLKHYKFNIT